MPTACWWLSVIPVDETPEGIQYQQLRTLGFLNESPAHARDGGAYHGTGYPGLFGDEWLSLGEIGVPGGDGDLAMRVEGSRVSCPEDINGDGVVNITDLLALLSAWGSCAGCPEDINGDGVVNITDLLALLSAWGPCL